ncbi:MAG: phosphoribosylformylglycinamidine cyclo-ligase, partial [Bacteroidetes bacterium]|nr:phosphoribosylformylglycinamidine cyclo-ligase [Bacteroidota bacterium]
LLRRVIPACKDKLHGIVHCTGGGQTKCLHFADPGTHIVKNNLLPVPAIFREIQASVGTPWQEMFRTFNMGHRLELYTDASTAETIIAEAAQLGLDAQVVGQVLAADTPRPTLEIQWEGQQYHYTG